MEVDIFIVSSSIPLIAVVVLSIYNYDAYKFCVLYQRKILLCQYIELTVKCFEKVSKISFLEGVRLPLEYRL